MLDFPETTWGFLSRVGSAEREQRRVGLEALCRRYEAPIREYARAAWTTGGEDADDIAQDFFVWLLEGEVLERYAPERGSFRNYLKGLLRNFGRNRRRAEGRLKRGGGRRVVELDLETVPAREGDAEAAFDRAFGHAVTRRAVDRLREQLAGDPVSWRLFEEHDLARSETTPTYAALAERFGLTESVVRNRLFRTRSKLRELVRLELLETVASTAELEDEWRRVIGT